MVYTLSYNQVSNFLKNVKWFTKFSWYTGYICNVPSVMFSNYKEAVANEFGLSYNCYREDISGCEFTIVNKNKFIMARLKYNF